MSLVQSKPGTVFLFNSREVVFIYHFFIRNTCANVDVAKIVFRGKCI